MVETTVKDSQCSFSVCQELKKKIFDDSRLMFFDIVTLKSKQCHTEPNVVLKRHTSHKLVNSVSNRVVNNWNALPENCISCSTVNTFKKHISSALKPETTRKYYVR